jgi:FAD/FMN-containing dehydrogenase
MTVLAGNLLRPGDEEYARLCSGWNTRVVHRPEYAVAARSPQHVQDAVRFAVDRELPIRVQSTGHGVLAASNGGMLIDTSGIGGVRIDPVRQIAEIGASVRWQELLDAAQEHDLAGLAGSASPVGVVGYALGGGAGWLARRYGLCSDTIDAAEVVTVDGNRRWVSADAEPDLLWALKGGGGNFGVVTRLRLRLVSQPMVFAGAIYWPIGKACELLTTYHDWVATSPPEMGSAVAFIQYPAVAPVPEPVRGVPVVALRLCHPGSAEDARGALSPFRKITGSILDTTRVMLYREIGDVTMDSPLHLPRIGYSESLREISDQIIDGLPQALSPGSPFLAMELRNGASGGVAYAVSGHDGLGYWNSPFLFFGMSVTPDTAKEQAALEMGRRLDAVFAHARTGTNALTFLLPEHTPVDASGKARVEGTFKPSHYAGLVALKKRYDPCSLLGGDRAIVPSA